MERDPKKRKLSQELYDEVFDSKYKKIHSQTGTNKRESAQKSALTEKIVSLWKTGSGPGSGPTSIATQESKDIVRLQEFETKYAQADKIIQSIRKKLFVSEENIAGLNILLKKETTEKQILLHKISTTWELIENISQHIDCVTENFNRFQVQTSDLSDKYNNVILKLRSENIAVQTEVKQLMSVRQTAVEEVQQKLNDKEAKLNELKVKCEILESQVLQEKSETLKVVSELENDRKRIIEMETVEKKMKVSIADLEEDLNVARSKLEQINAAEEKKLNEIRDNYELKLFELQTNFDETQKQLQEVKESRMEMSKCLQDKNNLLSNQDQEINTYQKQVRELMCQLTDIGLNLQRVKDEKVNLEKQLEKNNTELSRLEKEFETSIMENRALTIERNKLNDSLKKEVKERMELSADLTRSRIHLQESINRNDDMSKHLYQENEDKDCEIKNLQTQIHSLKQSLDHALVEKTVELQDRNELLEQKYANEIKIQREKYQKCLIDLDKLSETMTSIRKEDQSIKSALSSVTMEKEKLRELFSNEKKTLEAKLFESAELIATKTNAEKKLEGKLLELHADLATAEKKYKDLESAKDNKIMTLEKKLSNLGLSTVLQSISTLQPRKNMAKNTKNIHVKKEEIITRGKVKSILKSCGNSRSPKSSPKPSPKKISFKFGSDSSDDVLNFDHQNKALSCNNKFDELMKTGSNILQTSLTVSQSSNLETSMKTKKFFKSRGNL